MVPRLILVAVAGTATIALAAPAARAQAPARCAAADQLLGTASPTAVERAVACLVNAERAAHGLPPVRAAGALDVAAQRHAVDMIARDYFAHVSPTGGTLDIRAGRAGYLTAPCWALGEDLGWARPDFASAAAVVAAWMQSPPHRAVILGEDFREIGIGIVTRAPIPGGAGATFVLELGAMVPCADTPPHAVAGVRARPRTRVG